jgi:hypothetical protein
MGIAMSALAGPLAIAGLAGSAISAFGTYESGQATAASDAYQAQVAANNAAIAKQQSKLDIQSGEIQAVDVGLKAKAAVGQEKAAQGASGIDVDSGSAPAVRAGTAEMGLVDSLTARSNAAKKSYEDEVTAASDTAQSQLDTFAGAQATEGADIGAAGTLLSGASTVGANYVKLQNSTTPSSPAAGIG